MKAARNLLAGSVLVGAYLLLDLPSPWLYFVPAMAATLVARLVGPLSLAFVMVVLTLLGPVIDFGVLLMIAGGIWPGEAAEHVVQNLPFGIFAGIIAPPCVGGATWFAVRRLGRRRAADSLPPEGAGE